MVARRNWTWEATLAAFALYLTIPSGQHDKRNRDVVALADALGRSPGAVVLKLGNIKANDPMRDGVGLTHGSRLDVDIWEEYARRGDDLVREALRCLEATLGRGAADGSVLSEVSGDLPEGADRMVVATARVNQRYFRNSLLENYGHRCCFTGLGMDQLLVASHIKPWADSDSRERVSPRNGLLLNALHDRAFDQGLMTVDFGLCIHVSVKVPRGGAYGELLWRYDGQAMRRPDRSLPSRDFIEYHNDCVFLG